MRKERKGQSGQAIAELITGILAIATVFLGMLFVSAMGLGNIENLISARSSADLTACSEESSGNSGAVSLVGWNTGNDGLYFTPDDEQLGGGEGDGVSFVNQLVSESPEYDLSNSVSVGTSNYTSPFCDLDVDPLFVNAGGLVSASATDSDPLGSRGLSDLKGAFQFLVESDLDISLSETVYMPSIYYE
ncbi:MAG: hypothetical protein A2020_06580 [Lentisphaerae bacterium GWF2_45_14]|nr:MAG: hypothetical protein A2020_06580 [Lentisphaerae bacterium GWF2_45_14]